MRSAWVAVGIYSIIKASYHKVLAEESDSISEDFAFQDIVDGDLESLDIETFVQAIGQENIGADSKIDLGFHDSIGNIEELKDVSKDSTYISRNDIKEKSPLIIAESGDSLERILASAIFENTATQSIVPPPPITTPRPIDDYHKSQHDEVVVEETVTLYHAVQPAQRPSVSNREITSTRTTTRTIHHTSYSKSEITEPSTLTKFVEVVETLHVVPNTGKQETLLVAPQPEESDLAPPPFPPSLHQSDKPQPYEPHQNQVQTATPTSETQLHVSLPRHKDALVPQLQESVPGTHGASNPVSPEDLAEDVFEADRSIDSHDLHILPVSQAEMEVQIENVIKDKVEKYLREKLDKFGLVPSQTTSDVIPVTSTQALEPSKLALEKITLPERVNQEESKLLELKELKELIERELSSGFEDLNIDRLKNALNAVINVDQKIIQSASGLTTLTPTSTSVPFEDTTKVNSIADSKGTPQKAVQEVQNEIDLLEDILNGLDLVDLQGLSDKDTHELKKAKFSLDRLKQVPEEVLEELLYFYFAKDKRQFIDGILHRPHLGKVALDITEFNGDQSPDTQKDKEMNTDASNNSALTFEKTEEEEEKNLDGFEKADLDDEEYDEEEEIVEIETRPSKKLKKNKKVAGRSKRYKYLDGSTVSFEFDREKQKIGLKEDMRKGSFEGKYSNPEKEMFGKLSMDGKIDDDDELTGLNQSVKKNSTSKTFGDPLKEHSSTNSAGNVSGSKKNISATYTSKKEISDTFLERIKKNPSLLFQNEETEKDFDFTKSGSTGSFELYGKSAMFGAAVMVFWSVLLI